MLYLNSFHERFEVLSHSDTVSGLMGLSVQQADRPLQRMAWIGPEDQAKKGDWAKESLPRAIQLAFSGQKIRFGDEGGNRGIQN